MMNRILIDTMHLGRLLHDDSYLDLAKNQARTIIFQIDFYKCDPYNSDASRRTTLEI
jgi:hypothetical protein